MLISFFYLLPSVYLPDFLLFLVYFTVVNKKFQGFQIIDQTNRNVKEYLFFQLIQKA